MNVRDLLLTLIRCAIKGETLDVDEVKGALSEEKMAVLYKVAKSHDVAHLVCYALEKIGIIFENGDTWQAFLKEKDNGHFPGRKWPLLYALSSISLYALPSLT